jgi:hypothetical protein
VLEDRRLMSFAPAVNYAAGADPSEIIAADFNNDGRLDLVVANPTANSVNVLLGNGNGTFQALLPSAAGANPRSIAVGDFNADGKLDLAAISSDSYGVNVIRGNGNGTFAAPEHVAVGYEDTHSVATGDFNNDGKMDLVVSSNFRPDYGNGYYGYPQGKLDVLLAIGDGSFAAPRTFWTMDRALGSVVVTDLNGDGNRDVVTEMPDYSEVILVLGDGHGNLSMNGWSGWAIAQAPSAAADLTGDGKTDVVVDGGLLRGNGAGGFLTDVPEQFQTAGSGPGTVALGDFDHDGHLDIAKTDSIVRYAGNGTFSSEPYVPAPGPSATAVAAGDFNGDGWLDVATVNSTGNTVSVLLNDRTWAVTPPTVSISDAPMVTEGNTGAVNATFTVTLSKPSSAAVTVNYATADLAAKAGSDYVAKTGTLTIPAGQTSGTFTVAVIGDRIVESSTEEFSVQLTSATNATIANAWGTGLILDDEPRINIGNMSKSEGTGKGKNNTTTTFTFTVSLGAAYDQAVTVNYATANGTATAGSDYQAKSGSVTFAPGETIKTITIVVIGDRTKESNETFFVDLFGPSSNAFINTSRGTGTILNDDKR